MESQNLSLTKSGSTFVSSRPFYSFLSAVSLDLIVVALSYSMLSQYLLPSCSESEQSSSVRGSVAALALHSYSQLVGLLLSRILNLSEVVFRVNDGRTPSILLSIPSTFGATTFAL